MRAMSSRAGSEESTGTRRWRSSLTENEDTRALPYARASARTASSPSKRSTRAGRSLRLPAGIGSPSKLTPVRATASAARPAASEGSTTFSSAQASGASASSSQPGSRANQAAVSRPKSVPSPAPSSTCTPTHDPASAAASSASHAAAPSRASSARLGEAGEGPPPSAQAAAPAWAPTASTRRLSAVKPSASNARSTSAGSKSGQDASWGSNATGASVRIRATRRDTSASSTWARMFSPIFPLISPACSRTASSDPYWTMSADAFFGPMPGTPGMLSDVSPLRP